MTGKVVDLIRNGNINVPIILLKSYKKFKITDRELIVIIYLLSKSEFDPEEISIDLDIKINDVLKIIDSLSKKDILKLDMTKGPIVTECINTDRLYDKLAMEIVNEKKDKEITIYDKFEKEFARTLSPMEYEIIGAWIDNNYSEDIIELALKEAVYNGVSNLKYIDKILSEWRKKGVKSTSDVKKNVKKTKKEVFEYDWLNE